MVLIRYNDINNIRYNLQIRKYTLQANWTKSYFCWFHRTARPTCVVSFFSAINWYLAKTLSLFDVIFHISHTIEDVFTDTRLNAYSTVQRQRQLCIPQGCSLSTKSHYWSLIKIKLWVDLYYWTKTMQYTVQNRGSGSVWYICMFWKRLDKKSTIRTRNQTLPHQRMFHASHAQMHQ